MSDCIFCKIISDEIPSKKIYEDDKILAFLDIEPVSPGHALVIPKEHSENIAEMNQDLLEPLFSVARRLGGAAEALLGVDGFNLIVNKGEFAGQAIFHTHVHVIPRREGDELSFWPKIEIAEEEMEEIAQKMRGGLS